MPQQAAAPTLDVAIRQRCECVVGAASAGRGFRKRAGATCEFSSRALDRWLAVLLLVASLHILCEQQSRHANVVGWARRCKRHAPSHLRLRGTHLAMCVQSLRSATRAAGAAAGCRIDPTGACSSSPQNLCLLVPFVVSPATQSSQLVALPALPPALVLSGGQSDAEPSSWTIWPGSATVEYTAGAAAGAAQCAQGSGTKSNVPCRPVDVASLEGRPATVAGQCHTCNAQLIWCIAVTETK